MIKKTFLYFILFIPIIVHGQILNVEKGRQEADSVNQFLGNLEFQFTLNNRSATDEDENRLIGFVFNSDLGYISQKHLYLLFSNLNFIYATNDPVIRTGYTHFRSTFLYKKPVSYELFTQLQFDLGRGLQIRQLAGGGFRFNLVDNKKTNLHLGIGGMWERETWKYPGSEEETTLVLLKSSNYMTVSKIFSKTTTWGNTIYFQTGYDDGIDDWRHRMSIDTSLEFNLTDVLTFSVSFNGAYENEPVVPILKYMYVLQNGIKFSF